jgi:hypothetical protein
VKYTDEILILAHDQILTLPPDIGALPGSKL